MEYAIYFYCIVHHMEMIWERRFILVRRKGMVQNRRSHSIKWKFKEDGMCYFNDEAAAAATLPNLFGDAVLTYDIADAWLPM